MNPLKNKVVWVTGASSGIGEALCYQLAEKGAKLVLSSRNTAVLNAVKQNCKADPKDILVLPLDLENIKNADGLANIITDYFGRIDILVNNGGISQRALFVDTSPTVFRKIMEINFFGGVELTRAVVPIMSRQKAGHIVAISSVTGKFGTPLRSAYAASKHAMHGFYDALRAELYHDKIKVLLVAPGYVKTKISYNALLGDGSANNELDPGQANGISTEECANATIKAIEEGKYEIYPGKLKEVGAVYIKRFFPSMLRDLVGKVNVR